MLCSSHRNLIVIVVNLRRRHSTGPEKGGVEKHCGGLKVEE